MSNVDVSLVAVQKAMQSCIDAATELQNAVKKLKSQYAAAGSGWKDAKYRELGEIVNVCYSAMKEPVSQLGECHKSLNELAKIISDYQSA